MNDAHQALRERTREAHERVDAIFAGFDLTDRAGYRAMLRAHADVVGPIEQALEAGGVAALIDDWPERRRGDALTADLRSLGDGAPAALSREAPSPLPTPADPARVAGMLYVLEGSRLGGRFLARGLPEAFPRQYLDAHQAPGKWRDLLEKLGTILYEPSQMDSAVDAALEVFSAFEHAGRNWLAKV